MALLIGNTAYKENTDGRNAHFNGNVAVGLIGVGYLCQGKVACQAPRNVASLTWHTWLRVDHTKFSALTQLKPGTVFAGLY